MQHPRIESIRVAAQIRSAPEHKLAQILNRSQIFRVAGVTNPIFPPNKV